MDKEGFKIICNRCDSENVDLMPYEEKTVIECIDCGNVNIIVVIDD